MTEHDTPGEQQRLEAYSSVCEAIAESTGERCQRVPIPGTGYCALHLPDHLDTGDPQQADSSG